MAAVRHLGFFIRMRGTTDQMYMVVFITQKNSVISKFNVFAICLKIAYSHRFWGRSVDLFPKWRHY